MKYDGSRPMTRGAKRTLTAFSNEMLSLLTKKPFEEMTVGELCEGAQYPRATFYNYFDDKYDLLEYCWQTLAAQIGLSEYHHAPENEMLYLYFDRIYDFTRENRSTVSQILLHNPENGYNGFELPQLSEWTDAGDFSKVYGCCGKGDPQGTACRPLQQYAVPCVAVVSGERQHL